MSNVTPLPRRRESETVGAFVDTRDDGRALRVTWHHEPRSVDSNGHGPVVLLSLWRDEVCVATFRLPITDVPDLIEALRSGLDAAYDETTAETVTGSGPRPV